MRPTPAFGAVKPFAARRDDRPPSTPRQRLKPIGPSPPRQRLVGRLRSRHSYRTSNEDPLRVDCGKVAGSNPEAERLAVLVVRRSAAIEFHCGVLRRQGTSHPRHRASGECRLVIALPGRGPITKVWRKTDLLNRRMTMAKTLLTRIFAINGKYHPSALQSASVTVISTSLRFLRSCIVNIPQTSTKCPKVAAGERAIFWSA
jgi:hypothetical protein